MFVAAVICFVVVVGEISVHVVKPPRYLFVCIISFMVRYFNIFIYYKNQCNKAEKSNMIFIGDLGVFIYQNYRYVILTGVVHLYLTHS